MAQVVYLKVHNLVGQAELGDAILQHTADFVQCLEDGYGIAALHHFSGKGESCRATAHYGHLRCIGIRFRGFRFGKSLLQTGISFIISCEAFEVADGHGLGVHLVVDATALALLLLRTNTATDGRKRTGFFQGMGGIQKLAFLNVLDEAGNVDTHRATFHATWVETVEAAMGFLLRLFSCEALVHLLLERPRPIGGIKFRHLLAGYCHTLLGFHGRTEFLTPSGIAALVGFGRNSGLPGNFHISSCFNISGHCGWFFGRLCGHATLCGLLVEDFLGGTLLGLESSETFQHFIEVHLMAVELRPVHANELGLSAHGDAASTAHARAVHHDGVERDIGGNVVFLGQKANELHHDSRADGEAFVHLLAPDDLLDTFGDQSFLSVAAIVGHDDHFITAGAHFLFEDDEILVTSGKHRDDAVAGSFESLHDGEHGCHPHTAACTDHGAEVLNVCGLSQRANDIGNAVARLQSTEFGGRNADFLHYEGNGAGHGVGFGYGEGHTFAARANTYYHEVARLTRTGYKRSLDHQAVDVLREAFFTDYSVHAFWDIDMKVCQNDLAAP